MIPSTKNIQMVFVAVHKSECGKLFPHHFSSRARARRPGAVVGKALALLCPSENFWGPSDYQHM